MNMLKKLPRLALLLAILTLIWFAVAMFGAKLGLIDKLFAFGTMTIQIGMIAAGAVAVVAIIGLIAALISKPRDGWLSAVLALLVPLGFVLGLGGLQSTAGSVPFIYDITTNTADAPQYSAAMVKARADSGDSVNELLDFGKPLASYDKWAENPAMQTVTAAQLIADGYPDLDTLVVQHSAEDVLAAVESAMDMRGFNNVTVDKVAGTVEGTDAVFWYGFEDDLIARVRATAGGTAVDFRSTSRVGTSDLGVNAQRIVDLSKAVTDRLAADSQRSADTADEDTAVTAEPTPEAQPDTSAGAPVLEGPPAGGE